MLSPSYLPIKPQLWAQTMLYRGGVSLEYLVGGFVAILIYDDATPSGSRMTIDHQCISIADEARNASQITITSNYKTRATRLISKGIRILWYPSIGPNDSCTYGTLHTNGFVKTNRVELLLYNTRFYIIIKYAATAYITFNLMKSYELYVEIICSI